MHRFSFYFDYSPSLINFCRSLKDIYGWKSFSYAVDGDKKRWVFSDVNLIKIIVDQFPDTVVDEEALLTFRREVKAEMKNIKTLSNINDIKNKTETDFVVNNVKGDLYPYQKITVEFLKASNGKAIVASPPGSGKSGSTLGFLVHEGLKRNLVVCPASVKSVWTKEIKKWTNLSSVEIDGKTDLSKISADVNCWIVNYDLLKKFVNELQKTRFDSVVFDEVHLVKNPKSIRTKASILISRNIPRTILLSGTPLLSRPIEMFTLLHMIDPKRWSNWYDYARKFCGGHQGRFGFDARGATNTAELHDLIKGYFIRHKKEDVLKFLPEKNFIDHPVQMSPDKEREYNQVEEDLVRYLKEYQGKKSSEIAQAVKVEQLTKLNLLRQILAKGKLPAAIELIDSILDADEKVVVFSSFINPLQELKDYYGDKAVVITGQTNVGDRGAIVEAFQSDPTKKIFLGGIKSANTGITLTAATNCIFIDYSWTPADHEQALNRIHRPGQNATSVNIYQINVPGTIDNKLSQMLTTKQKIFDEIIDGKKTEEGTKIVKEVIMDMLERRSPTS